MACRQGVKHAFHRSVEHLLPRLVGVDPVVAIIWLRPAGLQQCAAQIHAQAAAVTGQRFQGPRIPPLISIDRLHIPQPVENAPAFSPLRVIQRKYRPAHTGGSVIGAARISTLVPIDTDDIIEMKSQDGGAP